MNKGAPITYNLSTFRRIVVVGGLGTRQIALELGESAVIVIVGLGPGDPQWLTREAWRVLRRARTVYLRTRKHPTVRGLPKHLRLRSFDGLYQRAADFDAVYSEIARSIIAAAGKKNKRPTDDVVYAVPGHPLVGERSVPMILAAAQAAGIPTRLVSGMSFIEPVLEALQASSVGLQTLDPIAGLQICDALDLARLHHPPLDPDRPALVAQLYSRAIASDVKLTLLNQYPSDHRVRAVRAEPRVPVRESRVPRVGTRDSRTGTRDLALAELDHSAGFDHLSSLYIPPLARAGGFDTLQETIAHLRAPEGCPWDREQTHQSLRTTLLEEAYEVLTAIDEEDMPALKEELGDLLLNVMLQAQIAAEADEFRMSDVVAEIDAKLKRRHPHIFGDVTVKDAAEVTANWNKIKKREKDAKGMAASSVLDGIAPALPALAQAQKMAHRADRAGFRWKSKRRRYDKVLEELAEVRDARDDAHRREELGDLIFSLAYWADGLGIDIETAAREGNQKFARRFRALETAVRAQNKDMSRMSEAALLAEWRKVKAAEVSPESRVSSSHNSAPNSKLGTHNSG